MRVRPHGVAKTYRHYAVEFDSVLYVQEVRDVLVPVKKTEIASRVLEAGKGA